MDDITCDFEILDAVESIPVFVPVRDNHGTTYDSPRHAARLLGLRGIDVERHLAGLRPSVGGFTFSFA